MATGTPAYNPPSTSGGAAVGSAITGATASRVVTSDDSGNLKTPTWLRASDANARLNVGVSDPVLISGVVGPGYVSKLQSIHDTDSNEVHCFYVQNLEVIGGSGFVAYAGGATSKVVSWNASFGGTFLGATKNLASALIGSGGTLGVGTDTNHDVLLGRNDAELVRLTANEQRLARGLSFTAVAISNTAHAIAVTTGLLLMSGFTANRAITLPAASTYSIGRILIIKFTDNPGAFNAQITPAGADTLEGAGSGSPMNLSGNFGCMILMLATATDWQRLPTVP